MHCKQYNSKHGLISIDFRGTNAWNTNMLSMCTETQFVWNKSEFPVFEFVDVGNMFVFHAFVPWKSTEIDAHLLLPRLRCIKDLFVDKIHQLRSRSSIISSDQSIGYFAYLTALTYDNSWTRQFWKLRESPSFLSFCFQLFCLDSAVKN